MKKIFIIAEAGVNHNGSLEMALKLIDAAAEAKADAVKFQTFSAADLVTPTAAKANYQTKNLKNASLTQFEMLQKLELSESDLLTLKKHADQKGILFLSTPFDARSAERLVNLVPLFKISSGDLTNIPLLENVASKGKPLILSTGMATLEEVRCALEVVAKYNQDITLLHCTTNYPCPAPEVNLKAMLTLQKEFNRPVGYSDHTEGIDIPVAAAALGACVIEKHFTLDKTLPGPDHVASLNPQELKAMVQAIRRVEEALGDGEKKPQASELETRKAARRSIVFASDLKAGHVLSKEDLALKRPGTGLSPGHLEEVIGRRLNRDVKIHEELSLDMVTK